MAVASLNPTDTFSDTPARPRELALEFCGSAREYFRVWIVNLCLTLLTAGIFSAWAKVRKKRYFYSHIKLDGTPFQYLGQPIPILKGRVIAVILFSIYYVSSHFFTVAMPYVLGAGAVIAPWVIVRSAAFNARYSAFRNMTFHFDGNYLGALRVLYAWGIVPVLIAGSIFQWWGNYILAAAAFGIFGLVFPWWLRRLKHFIVSRTSFGGERGQLFATGTQFFKVYFVAGLIITVAGVITGVVTAAGFLTMSKSQYAFMLYLVPIYAAYVLAFAYIQSHVSNLVWNQTHLGPLRFRSTLRGRGMALLYLTNALGIIVSAGLLTPWAVMRTLKYRADNLYVRLEGDLAAFDGADRSTVKAAGAELGEYFDVDLSL